MRCDSECGVAWMSVNVSVSDSKSECVAPANESVHVRPGV